MSRYQEGKTNLDFTEARESEWQWHQLGHMQVCTLTTTAAPHHSVFTGRVPFLPPNQQRQSTEGKLTTSGKCEATFRRTSDEHGGDREDLLGVGVGRDVAEADRRETGTGEVERRDVRGHRAGQVRAFAVDRIVEFLRQLVQPAYRRRQQNNNY